ncbi:hypothetical protein EZV62_008710 [Acer yangbiense]|uniref:CCHC-type domain-containing protein n=1 Tax=Acer yangbiense TaxID=1000413 RepID=A0A5C7IEL6_9ROSI|nr:hypothetical protein EZV62_008710 [Acer yangbiense]
MGFEVIEKLCASLSLKDREGSIRKLQDELKVAGAQKMALCLVGKILSVDLVNREAFKSLISRIWKVQSGGVEIEAITNNIYAFHFQMVEDRRKILAGGLWSFDNALIVLEEPAGKGVIASLKFSIAEFWSGCEIDKPLRHFLRMDVLGDGEEIVMPIKYERLPDFCFHCGILGHTMQGCSEVERDSLGADHNFPYGSWLKAESPHKFPMLWGRGGYSGSKVQTSFRGPGNLVEEVRKYRHNSWLVEREFRLPEKIMDGRNKGGSRSVPVLVGEKSGGLSLRDGDIPGKKNSNSNLIRDKSNLKLKLANPCDLGINDRTKVGYVGADHNSGDGKVIRPNPMLVGQPSNVQDLGIKQKWSIGPLNDRLELDGEPSCHVPIVDFVSVVPSGTIGSMKSVEVSSLGLSKVSAGPDTGELGKKDIGGVGGFSSKRWKQAARVGPIRESDISVFSGDELKTYLITLLIWVILLINNYGVADIVGIYLIIDNIRDSTLIRFNKCFDPDTIHGVCQVTVCHMNSNYIIFIRSSPQASDADSMPRTTLNVSNIDVS